MSEANHSATGTEHSAQSGATLEIQRIYVKEQSCKVPHAPGIFQQKMAEENKPQTQLEMNVQNQMLEPGHVEVTLKLHLTLKIEQQTALIMEVQQAGIFKLGHFDAQKHAFVLGAYCPGVLFPYARKAVSDLVSAAGFLPITLPAINFDALYQQRQQQAQQADPTAQKSDNDVAVLNETVTIQ